MRSKDQAETETTTPDTSSSETRPTDGAARGEAESASAQRSQAVQAESSQAALAEGRARPPNEGQDGQPKPRRPVRRTRRERAIIVSASLVAVLAGIVVVASLLSGYFQVQKSTGALAPTSTAVLGITPAPDYTAHHTPPPDLTDLNRALDDYIRRMPLDDELGQMIQVQFVGPNLGDVMSIPNDWRAELKRVHVGSVILYWYNIQSVSQLKALTSDLQSSDIAPNIPLIVSTDEEGGEVDYLDRLYGSGPTEASLGATGDPQKAFDWGQLDGQHLNAVGINADLAPVVDVKATPNPSIDLRMYGSDPTLVTNMASAFIDGLHSQGIMDALKHWPGIGWSSVDAHEALPVSNISRADLDQIDFAPYKALLAAGKVDMIMPTHVLLTSIDPTMPSSLSPIIIDGILRHDLGYQGVLITDALYMGALTQKYSMAESAVLSVIAGNDILSSFYDPSGVESVMRALHAAIDDGRITKARIDLSVKRILLLKLKYGIFHLPNYDG
jgi:beta-N-acetylhexosaminidase